MSGRAACFIWLFVCVLLAASAASAHETRPAYLEIKETSPGQFLVLWRTPLMAGMRLPVVLKLPDNVRDLREPSVQELADSLVERRWVDAGPDGLAGKRIEFSGLQMTITDVLVRLEMLDGSKWTTIAHPSQPWIEIAASQTWAGVAATYIVQGIRHILFGADHMLFVLGLLLIVKDRWMLLKTVTAFTVAHSITLAIATLGYAEMPVLPLNAAIALSILFLGPEIVRSWRGETSFTIQPRPGRRLRPQRRQVEPAIRRKRQHAVRRAAVADPHRQRPRVHPASPATPRARSQASRCCVARQLAGSVTSCFTTRPRAAIEVASMSSALVPTLPICGKVKVMIWPA